MGSHIHPTAIIHPEAQIAPDVTIGAYACIEGPAKIGAGTVISAHAILAGELTLGERNFIGHGAIIGTEPQDSAFSPDTRSGVVIGNDNRIRELVTIHRGTAQRTNTVLGDHNFLMAGSHVGHNVRIGSHVIMANNVLLAGHVEVGDRVFLGGASLFHQFIRIGRLSIAQGTSGASKDIPPYCILFDINGIAGINVVGLKRAGFTKDQRAEIRSSFKLLYQSGLNVTQAVEESKKTAWTPEAQYFWDFVESASNRGICGLTRRSP